jgi:hypothetical protein
VDMHPTTTLRRNLITFSKLGCGSGSASILFREAIEHLHHLSQKKVHLHHDGSCKKLYILGTDGVKVHLFRTISSFEPRST